MSSQFWVLRIPRSRCWLIDFLVRAVFSGLQIVCSVLTWKRENMSFLVSPLRRTLILSDQGSILMISFNLHLLFYSKYIHTGNKGYNVGVAGIYNSVHSSARNIFKYTIKFNTPNIYVFKFNSKIYLLLTSPKMFFN